MKYIDLKNLIEQNKLSELQEQIELSQLEAVDLNLVLRDLIKNKIKKVTALFNQLLRYVFVYDQQRGRCEFRRCQKYSLYIIKDNKNNLMYTCQQGTMQAFQFLIAHPKIDFNTEDNMKKTAPYYIIDNKNKNDAEIFLDKILTKAPHLTNRPANNETLLILAIRKQKPQLVRILLNHHAEPNYVIADSGNTPLHQALKMCKNKETKANKDIVKMLIQYGADPIIKNKKDKNVFEFAQKFPLHQLIAEVQVRPRLLPQETKIVTSVHVPKQQINEKIVQKQRVQTPKDKKPHKNDQETSKKSSGHVKNSKQTYSAKDKDSWHESPIEKQRSRKDFKTKELRDQHNRDQRENRDFRDRDYKDIRDNRDNRQYRENRQVRQHRENRENRQNRQNRDNRENRDNRQNREHRENRDARENRQNRENREGRQNRQNRENRQNRNNHKNYANKILALNTEQQIEDLIKRADQIYDKEFGRKDYSRQPYQKKPEPQQQPNMLSSDSDEPQYSDSSDSQPQQTQQEKTLSPSFRKKEEFTQSLSEEIKRLQEKCQQVYETARREFEKVYNKINQIAQNEGLDIQLYGSFKTGLWYKNCDIDILIIPKDPMIAQRNQNYIENILDRFETLLKKDDSLKINTILKNKKIRVQTLRLDIDFPPFNRNKNRKVDITVIDRNHNGLNIAHYINQNLKALPQLKPLFFVIKSLTYHFKLNDPKTGGIRTYAIVIMILSFLQNERMKGTNVEETELGELLLRFLYFFGFEYQYGYEMVQEHAVGVMEPKMTLKILDPLNHTNNLGNNAKAYELQSMFKAAFISLHANIKEERLQFMFGLKKIFSCF